MKQPLSPFVPCLTAFHLKLLAVTFMLIDHIGCFLLDRNTDIYSICRSWGRLAFPIFCFLIAEGARHTHSLPQYMARLAAFAFISTPPFNLVHGERWYAFDHLNVFFTLFFGLAAVAAVKELSPRILRRLGKVSLSQNEFVCVLLALPVCAALYWAAYALNTDYGGYGVAAILIFWLLRNHPAAAWGCFALLTFIGQDWYLVGRGFTGLNENISCNPYDMVTHRVWERNYTLKFFNSRQMLASMALLPCLLYNGEKGGPAKRNTFVKYAFYSFYPLHLTAIWLVQLFTAK